MSTKRRGFRQRFPEWRVLKTEVQSSKGLFIWCPGAVAISGYVMASPTFRSVCDTEETHSRALAILFLDHILIKLCEIGEDTQMYTTTKEVSASPVMRQKNSKWKLRMIIAVNLVMIFKLNPLTRIPNKCHDKRNSRGVSSYLGPLLRAGLFLVLRCSLLLWKTNIILATPQWLDSPATFFIYPTT